jgi:hypothetical protein
MSLDMRCAEKKLDSFVQPALSGQCRNSTIRHLERIKNKNLKEILINAVVHCKYFF